MEELTGRFSVVHGVRWGRNVLAVVATREGAFSGGWTVWLRMEKMEINCSKKTKIMVASLGFLENVAFWWLANYWLAILRIFSLNSLLSRNISNFRFSLTLIFSSQVAVPFSSSSSRHDSSSAPGAGLPACSRCYHSIHDSRTNSRRWKNIECYQITLAG